MKNLVYSLNQYAMFLKKLIAKTELSLKDSPDGMLKISHSRGQTSYCIRLPKTGEIIYISKQNYDLVASLAQKDYFLKLLKHMKEEFQVLEKFLSDFSEQNIDSIYNSLNAERRALVKPIIQTTEQYTESWLSTPYTGKSFRDDDTSCFFTDKGERVRSKSEVIIANILNKLGLPYKYECPLDLNGVIIYPDFTILDVRTRREIYFEHFGKMDDPDYSQGFVRKINLYEQNGIFPGKNLLFTVESSTQPLDTRILQSILNDFFSTQNSPSFFDL